MSDIRLRELERRWKESGSLEAEAAYLAEQLRAGVVDRQRLWLGAAFGHAAARLALGDEARAACLDWEIWYTDTFDREMPPQLQTKGRDVVRGLTELWRKTLLHSIGDDGFGTFTRFSLLWSGAGLPRGGGSVPVDPFENPPLHALRRWLLTEPLLCDLLGAAQARLIRSASGQPDNRAAVDHILACATIAEDPSALRLMLEE